jgi:hypothetical protein
MKVTKQRRLQQRENGDVLEQSRRQCSGDLGEPRVCPTPVILLATRTLLANRDGLFGLQLPCYWMLISLTLT